LSQTEKNVQAAFAGESQANRKYLAFAKKADQEGYPQIARLFRAVAAAETIHAHGHLNVLRGVVSTVENLKTAVDGEIYEIKKMYPSFIEQANKEGEKRAARSFEWALETEKVHEQLYAAAINTLEAGTDLPATDYYVCRVCGYTLEGEAPEKCPICGALQKNFFKVE